MTRAGSPAARRAAQDPRQRRSPARGWPRGCLGAGRRAGAGDLCRCRRGVAPAGLRDRSAPRQAVGGRRHGFQSDPRRPRRRSGRRLSARYVRRRSAATATAQARDPAGAVPGHRARHAAHGRERPARPDRGAQVSRRLPDGRARCLGQIRRARHPRPEPAGAREFHRAAVDLEQNFTAKTRALMADSTTDLDIEIEVLRDRLEREGVHIDAEDQV